MPLGNYAEPGGTIARTDSDRRLGIRQVSAATAHCGTGHAEITGLKAPDRARKRNLRLPMHFRGWLPCHCAIKRRQLTIAPLRVESLSTMQIIVRDNNVDQALRALKKKLQREGVYREMKLRRHYEKPSEKRAREHAAAVSRARKADRKRAERDN